MGDMKYEDEQLIAAIDKLMMLGDFDTRVEATEKAGTIILEALDHFTKAAFEGTADAISDAEDIPESKSIDTGAFSLE